MSRDVVRMLRKKFKKGVYDVNKAVDAWYHVATEASKLYKKEFGYLFSVADRFTVATDLEYHFREYLEEA